MPFGSHVCVEPKVAKQRDTDHAQDTKQCHEYLAQKGLATQAEAEGLAGVAVVVATGLWSIWAKRKALLAPPPASALRVERSALSVQRSALSVLLPLLLPASLCLLSGCLTRTRCQALTFDACTFNVNEPVGTDDPKYPRSLQIGVNDQQIEGGTDTIASGNKTDPSLQVPMGDSALSYLGQLLGGLVKGNPAAAAACAADGTCADPVLP